MVVVSSRIKPRDGLGVFGRGAEHGSRSGLGDRAKSDSYLIMAGSKWSPHPHERSIGELGNPEPMY